MTQSTPPTPESELVARLRDRRQSYEDCVRHSAMVAPSFRAYGAYDAALDQQAAATIERLHSAHKQMKESLMTCESVLQLCSERIASDGVAMNQIVDAFNKQKPNPNLTEMKAHQEKIDRYVFKAIDDARKLARQS